MKLPATVVAVLMLLLAGCASTPPLQTASGRPEVTVRSRTAAQVRSVAINHFVDQGFAPVKSDGNQLVFEKEGSVGQAFLMGLTTNNPQASNRLTITLVENGPDVRVVGGVAVTGNNNFGAQQVTELTGKGYQQLQMSLEGIKARAER